MEATDPGPSQVIHILSTRFQTGILYSLVRIEGRSPPLRLSFGNRREAEHPISGTATVSQLVVQNLWRAECIVDSGISVTTQ
jgi:hypothetical protein